MDLVPTNLYLGKNVNLTFTINDQLLACYSTNLLIIEHLKALNSAQRFFMKAELWAKLRNELRKQIRHTREDFDLDQARYYKRNNDIKWKSTGKIVGQNGSVVFIRHGGFHFKVNCSRIQIADSLFDTIPKDNNDSQLHFQPLSTIIKRNTSSDVYIDSDSGDEQYSINQEETSFDNKIKGNNSKFIYFTHRSTHIRFT